MTVQPAPAATPRYPVTADRPPGVAAPPTEAPFPRLFAPLDLRGLVLPNRIVLTAMVTRLSGEDGLVNPPIIDRYVRFARGGAGLIVVEATAVHHARSGPLLRLSEDRFIAGHHELVRRAHDAGPGKLALQIIHFLKIARSSWRQTVDMLSTADLAGIVSDYAAAAVRAREAGYDAVELHMAHAYTLSSFLSRLNRRQDAHGGRSLEARLRLPTEVALAVRAAVGPDFPVGLRFDGEECVRGGYGLSDATQIAIRLARAGMDYVSLSAGGKFEDAQHRPGQVLYPYTGYSGERTMPPAPYPDACNTYMADGVRQALRAAGLDTPVVASGKISTPELAEETLAGESADLIGMARALLADPDWPAKAQAGERDRIIWCVYGNVCKALDESFHQVRCVLWPKAELHAPEPGPADLAMPRWPVDAALTLERRPGGQLVLTWPPAALPAARVYGYEIFRAPGDGPFRHLGTVSVTRHVDGSALSGNRYRYRVLAYGIGGLRSKALDSAAVDLPWEPESTAPRGSPPPATANAGGAAAASPRGTPP
ncbi:MAG: NADH:flavin oxidoreductase [Ardenticatenia bacterium]|nr:NADH:flavin oxidoreductase [Ardenticatenia bacterium]